MYVRELHIQFRHRPVQLQTRLAAPPETAALLRSILSQEIVEVCGVLCLTAKNDLIAYHELSRGTLDASMVHPRDVCRAALLANAAGVVVGHNHPSGHVEPSPDDLAITTRLSAALEVVGITLADHIIVSAAGEYFSFRTAHLL